MPNQVMGIWILQFNSQDQIVRSGNYCCSSIRAASVGENKNSHQKITMTHTQTTCPTASLFVQVKNGHVLLRLEPWLATASAWKNSINAMIRDLGMLIGPWTLKSLNWLEKIQPRMVVAAFNGNPSATIISCYSPTNFSEETDLIAFYDERSSLVCSILKHNVLVVGGDMNAQIGKNVNHKFSLHNSSNRNGQHLTDFTLENRLTCLKTNFQKGEGKLWTYIYANDTKAQIDCLYK